MSGAMRTNQFGEKVEGANLMTPEKWRERWQKGQTKFHKSDVHTMLESHYNTAIENQPTKPRFFVPLCGKSVDMKWLAEKGCSVIGNEVSELGCRQFFEENNIAYDQTALEDIPGSVFKSSDKQADVSLYCCDFFSLTKDTIGGGIDSIWDRGSLVAVNVEERKRYSEVITRLMNPTASYLLCTVILDNTIFAGPPTSVTEDDIKQLFGSKCSIRLLEERDAMTDWQRSWGIPSLTEQAHLLKLK